MPWLRSSISSTASATLGSKKLGQPLPDSNFVVESNSSAPHAAHVYVPSSWLCTSSPLHGRSVPASRSTWYAPASTGRAIRHRSVSISGMSTRYRAAATRLATMASVSRPLRAPFACVIGPALRSQLGLLRLPQQTEL